MKKGQIKQEILPGSLRAAEALMESVILEDLPLRKQDFWIRGGENGDPDSHLACLPGNRQWPCIAHRVENG